MWGDFAEIADSPFEPIVADVLQAALAVAMSATSPHIWRSFVSGPRRRRSFDTIPHH